MKKRLSFLLCVLLLISFASCAARPGDDAKTNAGQSAPDAPPAGEAEGADYTRVFALLEQIPQQQELSGYTKESVQALRTAQDAVRYGLDKAEQDAVDGFAAALENALSALTPALHFSSLSEIIPYVDSLGIDFDDIASFSMDGYFDEVVLQETGDAGDAYFQESYYIGDSITLYMHRFSDLEGSHIYGVGSINPQNAAEDKLVTLKSGAPATFAEAMRELQPKRIVVTIGTNSMLMDSSEYLRSFAKLVEDLKAGCPDAQILLQSTPPLTRAYEANMVKLTNRNINRSNMLLAGLCVYEGVYFLNSAEALKDASGALDPKYDLGEGYGHINRAAYEVWETYLRTHTA